MYYRLVQRRLREPAAALLSLVTPSALVDVPGHRSTRAYVSESDPNHLLVVEAWAAPEMRTGPVISRECVRRLAELTVSATPPRWLHAWRWIERIGERPSLMVAVLERVAPTDEAAHLEWLRSIQDEVHARGLAVGQSALRDQDDPGLVVKLAEHATVADREAILELLRLNPSPAPILEKDVFVGSLAFQWSAGRRWSE